MAPETEIKAVSLLRSPIHDALQAEDVIARLCKIVYRPIVSQRNVVCIGQHEYGLTQQAELHGRLEADVASAHIVLF